MSKLFSYGFDTDGQADIGTPGYAATLPLSLAGGTVEVLLYDDYTLGDPGPVADVAGTLYRIGTVASGGAAAVDTAGGRVELETL